MCYCTKLLEYVCDFDVGLYGTYCMSLTKYTRKTSCLVSVFVVSKVATCLLHNCVWKIQLKGFIVIIALCVFSEVIFGAIMPSKEAARRNRRKSKNKAYYEAHKDDILLNKRKTIANMWQVHVWNPLKAPKHHMTKMWRNLVKNTADHSRACCYKHLEKSWEDTVECSKMWMCYYTS